MAKVTIYRLSPRSKHPSYRSFLTSPEKGREVRLEDGIEGALYVVDGEERSPQWVTYLHDITKAAFKVRKTASTGAVLFLSPEGPNSPTYACTWGVGHLLLKRELATPDLGLRVAFNLIAKGSDQVGWEAERVRAVRTKSLSQNRLAQDSQAPRQLGIDSFPVDRRKDVVRGITARPVDSGRWGRLVTGATSINVQRPGAASELLQLCKDIEAQYNSTEYRHSFAWLDNVRPVTDPDLRGRILRAATDALLSGSSDFDLTPPDLVDWSEVSEFRYSLDESKSFPSPQAQDFLQLAASTGVIAALDSDALESEHFVLAYHEEEEVLRWSVLKCLSGSLAYDGKQYVVESGEAYEVLGDFLSELNAYVDRLPSFPPGLPSRGRNEHEAVYNRRVAEAVGGVLLDGALVRRRGESEIELCDIVAPGRYLLHVKRGRDSAAVSYLLAQASTAAELLRADHSFREAARETIEKKEYNDRFYGGQGPADLAWIYDANFEPARCNVVIGISASWKAGQTLSSQLPFFAKVSTRASVEEMLRSRFAVSITLIDES